MIVKLKKECGNQTITRDDGKKIHNIINKLWKSESQITIDFGNILVASVSFIDEAFGKLAFEHTRETIKEKLAFINIMDYDKALLNDILTSRYRQKDLKQNGLSRTNNTGV